MHPERWSPGGSSVRVTERQRWRRGQFPATRRAWSGILFSDWGTGGRGADNGELLFPFSPYTFIAPEEKELVKQWVLQWDWQPQLELYFGETGETKQQSKSLSNADAQTANSRLKPGRCVLENSPDSPEDCRVIILQRGRLRSCTRAY